MPQKVYDEILDKCDHDLLKGYPPVPYNPKAADYSAECKTALAKTYNLNGTYYEYALYDDCWYQNDLFPPTKQSPRKWYGPPHASLFKNDMLGHWQNNLDDYPCGGPAALFQWLGTAEVKAALHVATDAYMFSGDNGVGFVYNSTEKNLMGFYKEVMNGTYNKTLKVLIYNGDADPTIHVLSGQNWTVALGLPETEPWRPWTYDGKQYMGGSVTTYKEGTNDFFFVTIRGAGHMVP